MTEKFWRAFFSGEKKVWCKQFKIFNKGCKQKSLKRKSLHHKPEKCVLGSCTVGSRTVPTEQVIGNRPNALQSLCDRIICKRVSDRHLCWFNCVVNWLSAIECGLAAEMPPTSPNFITAPSEDDHVTWTIELNWGAFWVVLFVWQRSPYDITIFL